MTTALTGKACRSCVMQKYAFVRHICENLRMRTTLVINDELYRRARMAAAERGATVTSVVEEALRVLLDTAVAHAPVDISGMPIDTEMSWVHPGIDINDNSALLDIMDEGVDINALR